MRTELINLVNELRKPENAKKVKRTVFVSLVAVIGYVYSMNILATGLRLVVDSGVPESTIKAIFGVLLCILGTFGFLWTIIKPLTTLFKIATE